MAAEVPPCMSGGSAQAEMRSAEGQTMFVGDASLAVHHEARVVCAAKLHEVREQREAGRSE